MAAIGILGGTFNPIHFGHLRLAQTLADQLNLDEVRLIPAATPPHKSAPIVSAEMRAEMVALAISGNPQFTLDRRELERPGHSYTIDTVESLRAELGPHVSLVLLMGSDAFTKFHTWHRYQTFMQHCHIALVQRPINQDSASPLATELETLLHQHYSEHTDDLQHSPAGVITMQAMPPLAIASTDIRALLQAKKSARYLVPDAVLDYIVQHQLYT